MCEDGGEATAAAAAAAIAAEGPGKYEGPWADGFASGGGADVVDELSAAGMMWAGSDVDLVVIVLGPEDVAVVMVVET